MKTSLLRSIANFFRCVVFSKKSFSVVIFFALLTSNLPLTGMSEIRTAVEGVAPSLGPTGELIVAGVVGATIVYNSVQNATANPGIPTPIFPIQTNFLLNSHISCKKYQYHKK